MMKSPEQSGEGNVERNEFRFESASVTEMAGYHTKNEDSILDEVERGLFGVFDGAGGMAAGDVASDIARNAVLERLGGDEIPETLEAATDQMEAAIIEAHEKILAQGKGKSGSTASALRFWRNPEGELQAVIGKAGDSRVYVLDAEKNFERVTLDDLTSFEGVENPAEALDRIDAATSEGDLVSDADRMIFNTKNYISQMLGQESGFRPSVLHRKANPGDRFLITSDGVHDNLTTAEIESTLAACDSPEEAAYKLVRAARARSGEEHFRAKDDDISAVVVDVRKGELTETTDRKETESVPERPDDVDIQTGGEVPVKRSDGTVDESGWIIRALDAESQRAIVRNEQRNVEKNVSQADLRKLLWERMIPLRVGDPVPMERSDGAIDSLDAGWLVAQIDDEGGEVLAVRQTARGIEKRRIATNRLRELVAKEKAKST